MPEQQPKERQDISKKLVLFLIIFFVVCVLGSLLRPWLGRTTVSVSGVWQFMSPHLVGIVLPHKIGGAAPPIIGLSQGDYPKLPRGGVESSILSAGIVPIFPNGGVYSACNYGVISGPGSKSPKHYAWAPVIIAPAAGGWQIAYPFYMHLRLKIPRHRNYTVGIFPGHGNDHMFTRIVLTMKRPLPRSPQRGTGGAEKHGPSPSGGRRPG